MSSVTADAEPLSSVVKVNPLRETYFGDLHLHTSFSFDAYILGTRITPDEAYRFARGEPVNYLGHRMQRRWPLDFMAVTDHAENLGVASEIEDPQSAFSRSESGRRIRWAYSLGRKEGEKVFYAKGVPMGGTLPAKPIEAKSPTFAIWASKDPNGANLDRVQVIKVWEENGQPKEKIFDVAWSDLRVLEIPTPRWSTVLAVQHGSPLPKAVPAAEQQRGWSSPLWYGAAAE